MAQTVILFFCVALFFARASHAGRLAGFLRRNEKRVDCRREDDSGAKIPEYYVTTISAIPEERLAYNLNPNFKYRSLGFIPKNFLGLAPLPFTRPVCAGLAIDPAANGDKRQQLYVDTKGELFLADYGEENSEYKPVRLHYDPDVKSVFVPFTHGENEFRFCIEDTRDGVKLSLNCKSKYDLERVNEEKE